MNGVAFHAPRMTCRPGDYRVVFKGDFVRGVNERRRRRNPPAALGGFVLNYRTGDGIEGGLFESWLSPQLSAAHTGELDMANDMNLAFGDARRGLPDCRPAPVCDPRPVCPACGGLECLCRPRFFAGQLLTEDDLNRLDHYIVAKNRLHNRYLFGTGVACGLEVVCSVCDPTGARQRRGQARLRAVARAATTSSCAGRRRSNVCDLINRCRPRRDDCLQPARADAGDEPTRGDEDWVLAICYQEKPSRGITALRGASCGCGRRGCGCGCGGGCGRVRRRQAAASGDASCGCGAAARAKTAKTGGAEGGPDAAAMRAHARVRRLPFAVYKATKDDAAQADRGALIKRFICCLVAAVGAAGGAAADQYAEAMHDWLHDLIAAARIPRRRGPVRLRRRDAARRRRLARCTDRA